MPRIALLPVFPQTVKISLFRFALALLPPQNVLCSRGSDHALRVHFNCHSRTGHQRAILWNQQCHSWPAGFAFHCTAKECSGFLKVWITQTWNSFRALPNGTYSLYMCSYSGPQPPTDKAWGGTGGTGVSYFQSRTIWGLLASLVLTMHICRYLSWFKRKFVKT